MSEAALTGRAYRSAWRMLTGMPRLVLSLLVVLAVQNWGATLLFGLPAARIGHAVVSGWSVVVEEVYGLTRLLACAAATMAFLRFELGIEMRDRWVWQVPAGFGRYLAWALVPAGLDLVLTLLAREVADLVEVSFVSLITVLPVVVLLLLWPFFLLAPGLAAGLPEASIAWAWRTGKGMRLRYLGSALWMFLLFLPVLVVMLLPVEVMAFNGWLPRQWGLPVQMLVLNAISWPVSAALLARVSARYFVRAVG